MELLNSEKFQYTVVLVTKNQLQLDAFKHSINVTPLLKEQIRLASVGEFNDLADAELSTVCGVIIDLATKQLSAGEMDACYEDVERIRTLKRECNFVFFAIVSLHDSVDQLALISRAGIDNVVVGSDAAHVLLNVFGSLRLLQSMVDRRRSKFKREDAAFASIGSWTFRPRFRSILLPNGEQQKLSETEWGYLAYLYDRDIRKIVMAENSKRKFEKEINQKSTVYKLKKKLGSDFPIVAEGAGHYVLRDDTDEAP